jgi:hypothetical protein
MARGCGFGGFNGVWIIIIIILLLFFVEEDTTCI